MQEITEGRRRNTEIFATVAQKYLDGLDVKYSSRGSYKSLLNRYWMPELGAIPIHAIRPSRIRAILGDLKLSGKTKRSALTPLRGVFDLAIEEELIDSNPIMAVRLKRYQKEPIDRFTPPEKAKILARLEGDALLYFLIFFEAGLRSGEILALNREDFDGTALRVSRSIVRRLDTDTKTHEARTVHCSPALRQALASDPKRFSRGPMFLNKHGRRLRATDDFNRAWRKALDGARVPFRRPYTCRHTRASEMLAAGVNPAYAAKQLGHTLAVFFRFYADWIDPDRDTEQLAKLDAMTGVL